jgi:hypothetical protein
MYIISGSTGQLGSCLVGLLTANGASYKEICLRTKPVPQETLSNEHTVVINSAFSSGGLTSFRSKGSTVFSENVNIIDRIVSFCRDDLSINQNRRILIINISSSVLLNRKYSQYSDYKSFYALAKAYANAKFFELMQERQNITVANIYVPNLFSEYEKTTSTHFVNQLATRVIKAKKEKSSFVNCIGNAFDSRELVYTPYFAQSLINHIQKLKDPIKNKRHFDVVFSSGDVFFIKEVASSLVKASKQNLKICFEESKVQKKLTPSDNHLLDNFEYVKVKSSTSSNPAEIDPIIISRIIKKLS